MYCRKENPLPQPGDEQALPNLIRVPMSDGEYIFVHKVVLKMVEEHANVEHVVVMENLFLSMVLFVDLLSMGIYASG